MNREFLARRRCLLLGLAPVISSLLTAAGTIGVAFSYTITATNSPTSFGASGLPAGLSINTTTGVISGTPTTVAGTSVTITATNAGGTDTKTLVITIASNVLALIERVGASASERPYAVRNSTVEVLTAGEWPNPVVSGQTSGLFVSKFSKGGTGKMMAGILSADDVVAGTSNAKYQALSDATMAGGWTLDRAISATRGLFGEAKGYSQGTASTTWEVWDDAALYEVTIDASNNASVKQSVDRGATWNSLTAPGAMGAIGSFRFIPHGAVLLCGRGTTSNFGVNKVSTDTGSTWTSLPTISSLECLDAWVSGTTLVLLMESAPSPNLTHTLYTAPTVGGTQTLRQTVTGTISNPPGGGMLCEVNGKLYMTCGESSQKLYRGTVAGLAAGTALTAVLTTGVTSTAGKASRVKALSDGSLLWCTTTQAYRSTDDGATWSSYGPALTGAGGIRPT